MGAAHGGVNCIMSGGRSALCTGTLYGGEGLSSVRLGLLQGLYERFRIKDLIRYYPPTQAGLYTECTLYRDGPLQNYFLHGQAGGLGNLMQHMRRSTIPRAQNRAGKGSIL